MGSIWREPEIHKSILSYVHTGHVPNDEFWHGIEHRRDIDPARFDHYHPNIAGFLKPPEIVGQLPDGPMVDDFRHRFEIAPHRFAHFHPFWGRLFAHEPHAGVLIVPPVVPPLTPSHGVPEPASVFLLGLGIIAACIYLKRRR